MTTNLTDRRFGRLFVVAYEGRALDRHSLWRCACDCGAFVVVRRGNLLSGRTESCGCLRKESTAALKLRHGHAAGNGSPEYESWSAMWARVRAKSGRRFRDYGARGITACERWKSFETFHEDMGSRPAGTSLDRIDNDGNYEPGNCRWATDSEQVSNKRRKAS